MYASRTSVSVKQSKADIELVLARYGADTFGFAVEPGRALVTFSANRRRVRFVLPLPVCRAKRSRSNSGNGGGRSCCASKPSSSWSRAASKHSRRRFWRTLSWMTAKPSMRK